MSNEIVSICIPVFNGEKTIAKTLESVLCQTYQTLEIIIVDNCSVDSTEEIIKTYTDDRIRYYKNESNLGMVGNWNRCIQYVTGKYLIFVCADDLLEKDAIKKKLEIIKSKEDIALVFSASSIINDDGKVLMHRHPLKKTCIVDGKKFAKKAFYKGNLYGEPTNVLIRKSVLDKVGEFATNTYYETDFEMWMRLSCFGSVGYVNEELMNYRIASSNQTSKIQFKKKLLDDKNFVSNMHKYNYLELTKLDDYIHYIITTLKIIARIVYMKLFC